MRFPRNPCSHRKACEVLFLTRVMGMNQTQAAIEAQLNVGTVNHIVRRRRFKTAYPMPPTNP